MVPRNFNRQAVQRPLNCLYIVNQQGDIICFNVCSQMTTHLSQSPLRAPHALLTHGEVPTKLQEHR